MLYCLSLPLNLHNVRNIAHLVTNLYVYYERELVRTVCVFSCNE